MIGGRVRDPIHPLHSKAVSTEFIEGGLGKAHWHVIIFMAQSGKDCAEEIINITHKDNLDMIGYLFLAPLLFLRISGVEDEIIHVHIYVNFII